MPALETMESVLITLWRASWQASLLILLVLLAQVTLRRWLSPAWRSALWLLVVARLLLPVTPSSNWSLFNLISHLDTHRATALDPAAVIEANAHRSAGLRHGDVELADPGSHVESPVSGTTEIHPHNASPQTASNDPMPGAASILDAPATTAWDSRRSWLSILFWIWLTGVLVLGARIVGGACLLSRRIRRHAVEADRRTIALLEESRRAMGTRRAPVLVETDAVDSPALFGLLRPKLLLPTGLIRRLDESELRHVFLHELAHLRRHDLLLNWLAALLQILHWFNPVVWFGFGRMRADREFACDALALTRSAGIDRAAYGTTILKLVSDLTPARPVAGLVGISEGKSHLKRRLRNIASYRKPTRRSTVTGTLVWLCLTGVTLTDARAQRDADEQNDVPMEVLRQQVDASSPSDTAVRTQPELAPAAQPQPDSLEEALEKTASQGSAPSRRADDGASTESGEQRAMETRIFRINVEKLIESQRPFGPAENLINNSPRSDRIVGIPAKGEESLHDRLPLPIGLELEDETATGLPGFTSINLTEEQRLAHLALHRFLQAAHVSVVPLYQIYFKPRRGMLMVRATTQELDNLQKALEALGGAQRKIELEVRAVELTRTESGEMGFDWFLGNTEAKPKSAGVFPGGAGATVHHPVDSLKSPAEAKPAFRPSAK